MWSDRGRPLGHFLHIFQVAALAKPGGLVAFTIAIKMGTGRPGRCQVSGLLRATLTFQSMPISRAGDPWATQVNHRHVSPD